MSTDQPMLPLGVPTVPTYSLTKRDQEKDVEPYRVTMGKKVGTGGNGSDSAASTSAETFPPRWERQVQGGNATAKPMERAIYRCPRGHEQARGGLCERCKQAGRRRVWVTFNGWRP